MTYRAAPAAFATALFTAIVAACSTFSAGDTPSSPPGDGGGNDGAGDPSEAATDGAAPCVPGACTRTVMAQSTVGVRWLVVDATNVIWVATDTRAGLATVFSCPKTGCDASSGPTVVAKDVPLGYLTSNGQAAFFSQANQGTAGVYQITAGGGVTKLAGVGSTYNIYWMTARSDALYVVVEGANYDRVVSRVALPAADMMTTVGTYSDGVNTTVLTASATRFYLGAHSTGLITGSPGPSGAFTPFLSGNDAFAFALATDDVRLFWNTAEFLQSCADGPTCASFTVEMRKDVGIAGRPQSLIYDRGSLFVETSGGDLVECKASSCAGTKRIIAHEPAFEDGIDRFELYGPSLAADADAVYYVARDGTNDAAYTYRVMRVQRSPL